jgi:bacterioferritin
MYSQVLKWAAFMNIADQLEIHAQQELKHALTISRQIDYLGKMPSVNPKPVRTSENAREMLRFDLDNENETVRNYRERIRQCESLAARGRSRRGSATQAKPPAPPPRVNSLRRRWGRHSACRDFYHGLPGEYAMAEQIRQIIIQEQDHQIDLATALGEEVVNVNAIRKRGN